MDVWTAATSSRVSFAETSVADTGVQFVKSTKREPPVIGKVRGAQVAIDPSDPWWVAHTLGHVIGLTDTHERGDRDEYLALGVGACGVDPAAIERCETRTVVLEGRPARERTPLTPSGSRSVMSVPSTCSEGSCDVATIDGSAVLPVTITHSDVGAVAALYAEEYGWGELEAARGLSTWPFGGAGLELSDGIEIVGLPSLTVHRGMALAVALGDDGRSYWTESLGSSAWEPFEIPLAITAAPAIVSVDYDTIAVAASSGEKLVVGRGGSPRQLTWRDWGRPEGPPDLSPPALTVCSDEVRVYTTTEGRLKSRGERAGDLLSWRSETYDMRLEGRPAVAAYDALRLDIVVPIANNSSLFHYVWICGYDQSGGQDVLESEKAPNSQVAITSRGNGRLSVFVVDTAGLLLEKSFEPFQPWRDWRPIAGSLSGRGVAAAAGADTIFVAAAAQADVPGYVRASGESLVWTRWQ
jgi:hypothetical protein